MVYSKFSPKQIQAMLWWAQPETSKHDAIVCDGSVRSGKTMSMGVGFVLWSCSCFDKHNFAFCGKTIESLRRNVVDPLRTWLEGVVDIKMNYSHNTLEITYAGRTNTYYMFGGRDESSASLVQGLTLAGVLLDEVALMPRSFVEQSLARCSVAGSRMWFNCNPGSSEHWFYKEWIQKSKDKNALHLHFTMADNYAIDRKVRERYERLYTGVFYERYIKGLWVLSDGLVYPMWQDSYVLHGDMRISDNVEWYISIDYGTLNPFSAGLWAVSQKNAIRVAEYYYSGRDSGKLRTDEEHYAAVRKLAGEKPIEHIIIDPSAASFIECARRHGDFTIRKAHNEVLDGIRRTSTLISNGKIMAHESCAGFLSEIKQYCWDEKKGADTAIKEHDHAMDDTRYLVNTILRRTILADLEEVNNQ